MLKNKKKDILTIPQAAELCAVDRVTMWRWIKAGKIRASVTPGGHYRILEDDLESFFNQVMVPRKRDYTSKNKILIVDDEPEFCHVISQLLTLNNYQTSSAQDGFDAGLQAAHFKPDLVLLDLIMPGMDGFEVCKLLKGTRATAHIKILAVTGYDTPQNREKIMAAGADGYLPKPLEKDILLKVIKELLGLRNNREKTAVPYMRAES